MDEIIQQVFDAFRVKLSHAETTTSKQVVRHHFKVKLGQKVDPVFGLDKEIALALAVDSVRVLTTAGYVVVEVPRKEREFFTYDPEFGHGMTFPIGESVEGLELRDIRKMPHMLVAGMTGSGKSAALNVIMGSLLTMSPADVQITIVDPKMVEFVDYEDFPHVREIVTDAAKAVRTIDEIVEEMEYRYRVMQHHRVRHVDDLPEGEGFPYHVLLIDEMSDLMLVSKGDVEEGLVRLAQLGRAAGIHLILATQTPRADIITGKIKANIPARWVFRVSSAMESRIAADSEGAEKLLGLGDSLFFNGGDPVRVQTPMLDTSALKRLRGYWVPAEDDTPVYEAAEPVAEESPATRYVHSEAGTLPNVLVLTL